MKEQFNRIRLLISVLTLTFLLQACGGSSPPVFTISADTSSINFENEFLQVSDDVYAINVTFDGPGLLVGYPPGVQPVPWFKYRAENVTATTATIYIEVINAEFIAAEFYTSQLRLTTGEEANFNYVHKDIDISLLVWQLSTDTELVSFMSTLGDTSVASQNIELTSETNNWTAEVDVPWLSLDTVAGTGSATISVSVDLTSFTDSGLQQGNIILTETSTGGSKMLPVELGLDNIYLYADKPNIALTSTQNITAIETVVNIASNFETAIAWQALTDAAWLTLTPVGDQLTITADPSMVPANETSVATVTISSTDNNLVVNETISVTLYNNDLTSQDKLIADIISNDNNIVPSPTLPEFYLAVNNELQVYHNYTGELLSTTIISPDLTQLEQFIVHPDGSYMLAKAIETITNADGTTEDITHRYNINLTDYTFTEITDATIQYEPTQFVRFKGRYFIVTQTLEYADENLQQIYWDIANAFFVSGIDVASQVNTLWALDNGTVSYKRFVPTVNDFTTTKITTSMTHEYHPETLADGDLIREFIISSDEKNIYSISSTSEWVSFNSTPADGIPNFIDNGLLEQNTDIATLSLSKNSKSQPHYLRVNQTAFVGFYIDIYNNLQAIEKTVNTGFTQPQSFKVGSDGNRVLLNNILTQSIELQDL